ncbi:MAG: glycosyltransferase family 4 protein [Gemmataceae bacterium]|nr:glycosyltransferase family 4 protein [Gemmataceae bacterium]
MHLGRREREFFPESYHGFRLIRTHGRVWGLPPQIDPERVLADGQLFTHPAVLSTPTLGEMRAAIDAFDPATLRPELVDTLDGYDLVRFRGQLLAIRSGCGPADLDLPEERQRVGAIGGRTREEVEAAIRKAKAAAPVEFAGWLPIYTVSGNCGKHPQFTHTGSPPPGYRFARTGPRLDPPMPTFWQRRVSPLLAKAGRAWQTFWGIARLPWAFARPERGVTIRTRVRVFVALVKLVVLLLRKGCKPLAVARFVQSRHLRSQLLMGDRRDLVFLTSMPYTFGQNPWVIEVEDPTTLFYPLIQNGQTSDLSAADCPYVPILKALLEADHCRAVLTHMRSTADMLGTLFQSDAVRRKVIYAPLGVKVPARWQRHSGNAERGMRNAESRTGSQSAVRSPQSAVHDGPIDLLFINSWCQVASNFYLRGGLDVLEAFGILKDRYPQLRLTMRTALPPLADDYKRIMESGWVRVVDRFVSAGEMADLHADSHIYLLPAARVHIVSLLQAMSYGLAVVGSDGWGIREYLDDGRNGLVVPGRYGVASWADDEAGLLRENYEEMYTPNPAVAAGIVEAVSRLVEDPELRARLGRTARADVETKYNLANWNAALKAAFDRARGVSDDRVDTGHAARGPTVRVDGSGRRPAGQAM